MSRLSVPINESVDVFEPEVGHREIHAVTRATKAVLAIKISVENREHNKIELKILELSNFSALCAVTPIYSALLRWLGSSPLFP
jgi:hypothetical protein